MGDSEIRLRAATRADVAAAGFLLSEAAGPLADPIMGLGTPGAAAAYLGSLFSASGTPWSYSTTAVAELGNRVVGLVGHLAGRHAYGYGLSLATALLRAYGPLGSLRLGWRAVSIPEVRPDSHSDDYHVANLAVHPELRGRGIGARLLDHAHSAGRSAGASACGLEVLIENVDAQRLYARHGYREVARKTSRRLQRRAGVSGQIYMSRPL